MNKEQTKEAITVMQAFVDGKKIQYKRKGHTIWQDFYGSYTPSWGYKDNEYRVKPEIVKYRRAILKVGNNYKVSTIEQGNSFTPADMEACIYFVRWIDNDWQEEVV